MANGEWRMERWSRRNGDASAIRYSLFAIRVFSLDPRQRLELVERRRRRQGPFQRRGALAPRIVGCPLLAHEDGDVVRIEEPDDAGEEDVGAEGGDGVPAGEAVGIVDIAARHAGQAQKVLREEDQVRADE